MNISLRATESASDQTAPADVLWDILYPAVISLTQHNVINNMLLINNQVNKKKQKENFMVKSKFNIMLYILYPMLAIAAGFATYYFVHAALFESGINTVSLYILGLCVILMDLFAVIHPFTACYDTLYDGEYLVYRWKFIPRNKIIRITDIEGYYTMKVPSRDNEYLTAFPVTRESVLPSISSFYYDNCDEVIKGLPVKHLGELPFSWKVYFRMAFRSKRPD